jgi:hypothetical protein
VYAPELAPALMPRIKNISGPYRLFFFSFDCNEPPHVHAERENAACKFWLDPVALASNHGFSPRDLNRIRTTVYEHLDLIKEQWDEHCGGVRAAHS